MSLFDPIIQAQQHFFSSGQTLNIKYRKKQLHLLKKAILLHQGAIENALQKDLGKNSFDAYASEIGIVLNEITVALKLLNKKKYTTRVRTPLFLWPSQSKIIYEPYGVCLIISPWNYPFQLSLAPLVNAMAAGNCCVVKPSERSTHTTNILQKILSETFDSKYIATILADKTDSVALLEKNFDKFFFTGSKSVGKTIYQAAAKKLIPVTLELGGKNPCIVTQNANLRISAQRIAWGKFFNAGQTCVAPDYLVVHKDVKAAFLQELKTAIETLFGNTPQASPYYGRIIDTSHLAQLTQLLSNQTIWLGGTVDEKNCYLAPTIVNHVSWTAPLMDDEIFGPILPIIEYTELEDALHRISKFPKPLAFYIFASDNTTAKKVFKQIRFGGGCLNDTLIHFGSPYLPVGGIGPSGLGRYHGFFGFEAFSNIKTYVRTPYWPNLTLRYPPFPSWKQRLLHRLMR